MTPHTIRIQSSVAGFRRAGIAHPAQPIDYPIENFTEEQIQQLVNEPVLSVAFIADDGDGDNGDPGDEQHDPHTPPGDDQANAPAGGKPPVKAAAKAAAKPKAK